MEIIKCKLANRSSEFSGSGFVGEFTIKGAKVRSGLNLEVQVDGDDIRIVLHISNESAVCWHGRLWEDDGDAYASRAMDAIDEELERIANLVDPRQESI
jgi:hypothetical protein